MPPRATFRDVFAVREFRALWFSEVLSVAGDRLALVALTLLVFHQTGSPLLTAIVYATGYVPWVIGGLFLADVADRRSRRSVMVVCDVVRAVLVAAMAVPHVPLGCWWRCCSRPRCSSPRLNRPGPPSRPTSCRANVTRWARRCSRRRSWRARRSARSAEDSRSPSSASGPRSSSYRRGDVRGFRFVHSGSAPAPGPRPLGPRPSNRRRWPGCGAGFGLLFGDQALRTLLLLGWLVVFYTIPEGVAAPYTARLGGGPIATGVVLASTVFSTAIATPLFTRFVRPRRRLAWMGPLAVLTCATLVLTALRPGLAVSLVIFSLSAALRCLPDRDQHRVRRPGAERTTGSGLRHRQDGFDRWPGGRFRRGRRRRGGGLSGGGHRRRRRDRCDSRLRSDAQVAPRVATRRASCGGTASRSRRDEQKFGAAP